jgi:hypothetical protein
MIDNRISSSGSKPGLRCANSKNLAEGIKNSTFKNELAFLCRSYRSVRTSNAHYRTSDLTIMIRMFPVDTAKSIMGCDVSSPPTLLLRNKLSPPCATKKKLSSMPWHHSQADLSVRKPITIVRGHRTGCSQVLKIISSESVIALKFHSNMLYLCRCNGKWTGTRATKFLRHESSAPLDISSHMSLVAET